MNWDAISAISETIASIAVVVSLLYLSIQVKQSNKLSQSQTRTDLRHMAQTEVYKLIDFPGINQSFFRDEISEEDAIRLHNWLITALRFREFIWRQHQQGLLDTQTFKNYSIALLMILGSDRNRKWWERFRHVGGFDPAYVAFVDNLLLENPRIYVREIYQDL